MTRTSVMKRAAVPLAALGLSCAAFVGSGSALAATNLSGAESEYGTTQSIEVSGGDTDELKAALTNAGTEASAAEPVIVYAEAGTYQVDRKLTVPENVVLVADDGAVFSAASGYSEATLVDVAGSVYGGSYDAKNKAKYCLWLRAGTYSGTNGTIEKVSITKSAKSGIVVEASTGVTVRDSTAKSCGTSGISALNGATIDSVEACTTENNGEAGVNLGHADIKRIANNKIVNNGIHGISTDTENTYKQKSCSIQTVTGNEISGNGGHGIYLEKNCTAAAISGNTISGNNYGIAVVGKGTSAKKVSGNIIKNSKHSNITVTQGATLYLTGKNKSTGANAHGLSVSGASVSVSGTSNQFSNNKQNGITVTSKASLKIAGKKTQIKGNKHIGLSLNGNSKANIANVTFGKNKKFAAYVGKGSKLSYKKTNLSTNKNAANRLYIA